MGLLDLFVLAAERVRDMGAIAVLAYLLVYIVGTVVLVPGGVLAMVCGAIFGVFPGFAIAFAGATLGSSAAFFVARLGGRTGVIRWLHGRALHHPLIGRIAGLDRSLAERSFSLVLLLRLSPFVPYNLLNYVLGLTGIRFRSYTLAAVGMLPGAIVYSWAGSLAEDIAAAAAGRAAPDATSFLILIPGLLVTLAAAWLIGRYARRELERLGR